jgi:hypothetical protein
MLLENPKGNYSFVSGRGVPFSSGAIAEPEMAARDDGRREIVAAGDVSPDALRRKTVRILDNLSKLLNEMELGWSDASAVKLQLCCRCAITYCLRLVTYSRFETSSDLSTIQEPRSSRRKCRSSPSLNRSELRE